MNKKLLISLAFIFVPMTVSGQQSDSVSGGQEWDIVVLGGLDKITAQVSEFSIPVDETASFGTLQITPRSCHKAPPEETPEVTAFLEIEEKRSGYGTDLVFSGWMFASSPAISALEHPVYDVWVTNCRMSSPDKPDPSE